MMERKDEFLSLMQKTMEERGYTLMILMLTDVLLEGTQSVQIAQARAPSRGGALWDRLLGWLGGDGSEEASIFENPE